MKVEEVKCLVAISRVSEGPVTNQARENSVRKHQTVRLDQASEFFLQLFVREEVRHEMAFHQVTVDELAALGAKLLAVAQLAEKGEVRAYVMRYAPGPQLHQVLVLAYRNERPGYEVTR